MKPAGHAWPPHRHESRDWAQAHRGGTRDDRMLRSIVVSLPPLIADRTVALNWETAAELEAATSEITKLDGSYADDLSALGTLLLRTESVASSKIEQIEASVDDYARALHGVRANSSAVAMVAATTALEAMIGAVGSQTPIRRSAITTAHAALMRDDLSESSAAGELRTVQNWIGGSDFSPRGALYIPPPPGTVPGYLDDLITFADRSDMPEGDYSGGGAPLVDTFMHCTRIASAESRVTAQRLHEIPSQWQELPGPVRRGSAAAKILDLLPSTPILSSDDAVALVDAPRSSVFDAISRLGDAGVLRALTDRKRDQIWGASLVLDELEDLGGRIAAAVRR